MTAQVRSGSGRRGPKLAVTVHPEGLGEGGTEVVVVALARPGGGPRPRLEVCGEPACQRARGGRACPAALGSPGLAVLPATLAPDESGAQRGVVRGGAGGRGSRDRLRVDHGRPGA